MRTKIKYTIVVDALQILCVGKIGIINDLLYIEDSYKISEQILLKRNYKSNPGFLSCFDIILNGNHIGQLFYGNNGKYRFKEKDTCQINLENHTLYQSGWIKDLQMVMQSLELNFQKYRYMEIAVDGLDILKRYDELIYDNGVKVIRDTQVRPNYVKRVDSNSSFNIGSLKSERHISIYNKTEELKKSKKEYISEFWNRNGLGEVEGPKHRCEVRLQAKALKRFSEDLMNLENPSYLASYFKLVAGSFLEFSDSKDNKTRYHVINWHQFENIEISKPVITQMAQKIVRYKYTIRYLFEEYVISNDKQYLYSLASLTAKYQLKQWLMHVMPRWIREFRL